MINNRLINPALSLSLLMTGPSNHCQVQYVGITILSVEWDMAFANNRSVEQEMFKTNLSSTVSCRPCAFFILIFKS